MILRMAVEAIEVYLMCSQVRVCARDICKTWRRVVINHAIHSNWGKASRMNEERSRARWSTKPMSALPYNAQA